MSGNILIFESGILRQWPLSLHRKTAKLQNCENIAFKAVKSHTPQGYSIEYYVRAHGHPQSRPQYTPVLPITENWLHWIEEHPADTAFNTSNRVVAMKSFFKFLSAQVTANPADVWDRSCYETSLKSVSTMCTEDISRHGKKRTRAVNTRQLGDRLLNPNVQQEIIGKAKTIYGPYLEEAIRLSNEPPTIPRPCQTLRQVGLPDLS